MSEKEMANITAQANEARLSTLAAEINTIKRQTQKIMMEAAVEIGRRLVEAKGAVGHGGWGLWLERNVDYSERTAQNLIRIFQEYGEGQQSLFGESNPQAFADLTYTQAVALLGIKNPDERAEFVESHDVQNMTSRELADAIKERDEARAALSEAKEQLECSKADVALGQQLNQELEKEKQDLQKNIDALEEALKESQEAGGGEPDEETKKRIEEMEKEKAALKEKLKEKENTIKQYRKERDEAEKQRQEIANDKSKMESELKEAYDNLWAEVQELRKRPADTGKAAFAAYFNLAKNAFNGMLEAVTHLEDGQEKYRAAMVKMLEAMIETAKEG